ncbi:MAG: hypothetical protein KAS67_01120 [Thermoplasmata archaeon]|nr:hypothetical protein [Thermoplasmata archaeon]
MKKEEQCIPKKGDWVVIVKDKIVACESNPKDLMVIADKYPPEDVIIAKEPSSNYCYY